MSRRKNMGTAIPRLQQDYLNLNRDPVPYIRAEPLPDDMLEWHYVIKGPENTPYFGGYYHGWLLFTQQYPFKPPSIYMATPNGRFETNRRLCLSISDYHPDEWNPSWCVSSILTGLLSFMLESSQALGTIETTQRAKEQFARASLAWNVGRDQFRELFPDLTEEIEAQLAEQAERGRRLLAKRAAADGGRGDGTDAAAAAAAGGQVGDGLGADAQRRYGDAAVGGGGLAQRGAGDSEGGWQSLLNNALLLVFTGLMGFVGYHVFGIISAE